MPRFLRSIIRFNWSVSVAGARRVAGVVVGGAGLATRAQLDEWSRAVFQAGDELNDLWIDGVARAGSPAGMARNMRTISGVVRDSQKMLRLAPPGEAARREYLNRLEVYRLVKGVRRQLGLPKDGPVELAPAIRRAYALDAHRALWLVEGLAHDHVAWHLSQTDRLRDLFRNGDPELPDSCRPMLACGLGLGAAEFLLERQGADQDPASYDRTVREFVRICEENSEDELTSHALEALGLVARCFYPETVPGLDAAVKRVAGTGTLREYLWHGVGRGVYFSPASFVPGYGSISRAIDICEHGSPDAQARDAALPGLAYAFNLVNMAHPLILEDLLDERGEELRGGPFADGLVASFSARQEVTPGYPHLRPFVEHQPRPGVATLWRELIRTPCLRVLESGAPAPRALGD